MYLSKIFGRRGETNCPSCLNYRTIPGKFFSDNISNNSVAPELYPTGWTGPNSWIIFTQLTDHMTIRTLKKKKKFIKMDKE